MLSRDHPGMHDEGVSDLDWADAIRRLGRTRVLVIGDVMLDRFVYGAVERVSPEAPVPVIRLDRDVAVPGGAGNIVRNLTALGAAVTFIAVVGDDQPGSELTGLIGGQNNVEPWLLVQGGRLTTVKTRYVAHGQHLLRADQDDPTPVHAKLAERLIRIGREAMAGVDAVLLADYGKGVFAGDVAPQLVAAARAAGRAVIVRPSGPSHARYAEADIITPSRRQVAASTSLPVDTDDQVAVAAGRIRNAHGIGAVLVDRAEDGLTLVGPLGASLHPIPIKDVFDVAGSGDTIASVMAAGTAAGLTPQQAARLASLAVGIVVGRTGTAVARQADLLAALSPRGGALRKIVDADEAAEQAERWRQRGWRIGFTNGVFDLLHPGHMHLLAQARAACDRLIVGVNSDASVRRLKGEARPVQPEAARAAVLAGNEAVDLVTVFDDDTPARLIEALRPDVLVKGADYGETGVIGADTVRGWGGRVVLAELLPGHSTTAMVARLRG